MKSKIIYTTIFLAAFLITTAGIIYLNSIFKDMFRFDFSVVQQPSKSSNLNDASKVSFEELKGFIQTQLKTEFDSLRTIYGAKSDTVVTRVFQDSLLIDSVKTLQQVLQKVEDQLKQQASKNLQAQTVQKVNTKPDTSYINWTKQTAKLYESMDPKSAAKIISSYSDNVARDIIYSMRQKKAADILSELNPETANRITQAK